jgi:hypothetical protein
MAFRVPLLKQLPVSRDDTCDHLWVQLELFTKLLTDNKHPSDKIKPRKDNILRYYRKLKNGVKEENNVSFANVNAIL